MASVGSVFVIDKQVWQPLAPAHYVYYRYGSCNDGSCSYGLLACTSLQEAESQVAAIMQDHGSDEPSCVILKGDVVKTVEWGDYVKG
jgi:hypothetical protein